MVLGEIHKVYPLTQHLEQGHYRGRRGCVKQLKHKQKIQKKERQPVEMEEKKKKGRKRE